jgi:hypothetical protein
MTNLREERNMAYTQALGRQFWFEFDKYFKYDAAVNGLGQKYDEMGGYDRAATEWGISRRAPDFPTGFKAYVLEKKDPIDFLAKEQKKYFDRFFAGETADIVSAFQDFAFGILSTPTRTLEPVHTMNGGLFAQDYLSWYGFMEAAIIRGNEVPFWTSLRWIGGMAWELQAKARPQEVLPNMNEPLPVQVTQVIKQKWEKRTAEQIAVEFENYRTRPIEWLQVA